MEQLTKISFQNIQAAPTAREEGNSNPFQYSCLENPMDRGAWQAIVHGVAKSQTQLSNFTTSLHTTQYQKNKNPVKKCKKDLNRDVFKEDIQIANKHMKRCLIQLIISQSVSSVTQSSPTLCDPMNRSTPGLPVHHKLPEFTQTHVHRVGDALQPSHPLQSPSPLAPNPSHLQGLFQ